MQISALELARKIRAGMPSVEMSESDVGKLAMIISNRRGIFKLATGAIIAVLDDLLHATPAGTRPFRPVLVTGEVRSTKQDPTFYTQAELIEHFLQMSRNTGKVRPKGYVKESWVPAADQSLAPVPLGGDIGLPNGTTPDRRYLVNTYHWYDLNNVAHGQLIYRVTATGRVQIFQRIGPECWVHIVATTPPYQDCVDVDDIFRRAEAAGGEQVLGINPQEQSYYIPLIMGPPAA